MASLPATASSAPSATADDETEIQTLMDLSLDEINSRIEETQAVMQRKLDEAGGGAQSRSPLDTLTKAGLNELTALKKPPSLVPQVALGIQILFGVPANPKKAWDWFTPVAKQPDFIAKMQENADVIKGKPEALKKLKEWGEESGLLADPEPLRMQSSAAYEMGSFLVMLIRLNDPVVIEEMERYKKLLSQLEIARERKLEILEKNKDVLESVSNLKKILIPPSEFAGEYSTDQQAAIDALAECPKASVVADFKVQQSQPEAPSSQDLAKMQRQICAMVSSALKNHKVRCEDIDVQLQDDGGLKCNIKIMESSMQAVKFALEDALKNCNADLKEGIPGLGLQIDCESSRVSAKWPIERIRTLVWAKFDYDLEGCLEELVGAVEASAVAYRGALEKLQANEPDKLLELQAMDGMSMYEGQLLTAKQADEKGLMEDWVCQESGGLEGLMESAHSAQKGLKNAVAPGSPWASKDLNDPKEVPHGHPDREVKDVGCAKGGVATDPGIKGKARIEEKATSRQKPHDVEPPYHQLVDVSRLGLVYETVTALFNGLNMLLQKADVLWVDNKFKRPSALGYSDVNVGVRTNGHISEVQLSVGAMFEVKMTVGHVHYETIRSLLAQKGVSGRDMDAVQRLILKELDRTDGAQLEEQNHLEAEAEATLLPVIQEANSKGALSQSEMDAIKKTLAASKLRPLIKELNSACRCGDPDTLEDVITRIKSMAENRKELGLDNSIISERLAVAEARLLEVRAWVRDLDATLDGVCMRTIGTCPSDRVVLLRGQAEATCRGGDISEKHPSVLKAMSVAAELDQIAKSLQLGAKADEVICRPCSAEEQNASSISTCIRDRAQDLRDEVNCLVNRYPRVLPDDDNNVVVASTVIAQLEALQDIAKLVEDKFRYANKELLILTIENAASLSQSAMILKLPLPNIRNISACFHNTSEMLLDLANKAMALEDAIEASNALEEQHRIAKKRTASSLDDEIQRVNADLRRLLWAIETQQEAWISGNDAVDSENPIVVRAKDATANARSIWKRGRNTATM